MHKKLKSGNYCDIKLVTLLKNDIYVEKIYGKKTIIGAKFMPVLFSYFMKYRKMAESIDLPICDTSYEKIIQGSKNSYIVEFQSYIGTNFEDFLRNEQNPQILTLYIEKYLRIFQKIWKHNFPIGVDPSIRNFGIDNDGELKYFDFFPPHQKDLNSNYFLWPEPSVDDKAFFVKRYFTHDQVRVIYGQLLRHLANHRLISPQKVKTLISSILGATARDGLIISPILKKRVLEQPNPHDMDIIRMIACELCYEKKLTYNQLTMVFKNSHIQSNNILASQANLTMIVKILNNSNKL